MVRRWRHLGGPRVGGRGTSGDAPVVQAVELCTSVAREEVRLRVRVRASVRVRVRVRVSVRVRVANPNPNPNPNPT